ncbi:hypothetical protein F889_00466 [Acinetobacter colistiniresistens]|uniref:AlpA family phage regulatory protein n=1 Tax=Acinetobacter colistiniresistens TaxID=280145 RepID=N9PRV5_9GAMM|nr:hypothetical protein F889_00466 [Acinetobacter colistiniresistens]TVT77363.1 hypothetical protein FPV60_19205 [Acinetobacter colistiniresistens]
MSEAFLRTIDVRKRYGNISGRTLCRWQETRNFPAPFMSYKGGPNLWKITDLVKWEESQSTTEGTA